MGVASKAVKALDSMLSKSKDSMFNKSKAELKEIAKGKGSRAMDAEDELERRLYNKDVKSGRLSGPYTSKEEYAGDRNAYEEARYKIEQQAKTSALTKKQEKAADKQAESFAMGKEQSAKKAKPLTEKEKKEMQESLNFKKGGMVKKPAAKKMMGGGMASKKTMAYAKGGMVKCGASNPPAQKGKK